METERIRALVRAKITETTEREFSMAYGTLGPIRMVYVQPRSSFANKALAHKDCGNWVEAMPGMPNYYSCRHCHSILHGNNVEAKDISVCMA